LARPLVQRPRNGRFASYQQLRCKDSRRGWSPLEDAGGQVGSFQRTASARLPTATAPQNVHTQEERQAPPLRDTCDEVQGDAGVVPARPGPHRGNSGRRAFIRLSTGTVLSGRRGSVSQSPSSASPER